MEIWPLGVFTSINAGYGVKLEVARALGVSTIQLHAPRIKPRWWDELPRGADSIDTVELVMEVQEDYLQPLRDSGLTLTAVFGGFEGESYADIPTVARTVGLVPPETRAARLAEMKRFSFFASALDCHVVALHLGFVPHNPAEALYPEMLEVTRDLCDHCRGHGQNLHLETGQEPAEVLRKFIKDVGRDNLFINFDPANMIMYGVGDPLEALEMLGPLVRSVHCKDAKWAVRPGQEWGKEVPLGQGAVNIEAFLRTLKKIGYEGPLTVERELPQDPDRQRAEIAHAIDLLKELKRKILT